MPELGLGKLEPTIHWNAANVSKKSVSLRPSASGGSLLKPPASDWSPGFRRKGRRRFWYGGGMNLPVQPPASPLLNRTTGFVVTPVSSAFADRIRLTLRDDFDRAVHVTLAQGGEPLRDQVRRAAPGERIILCSHQAVPLPSPFAEIGPIFIAAEPAAPAPLWRDELPPGYFPRTLALRAYDGQDGITDSVVCEPAVAPGKIREFLDRPGVAHVHARFAGHGCYACRFDRAG